MAADWTHSLFIVFFLAFLEGILSIDNALVLALLVKGLPEEQRKKALTYGMGGAVVFRLLALAFATTLLKWHWVKYVGGGYLIYIALKNLIFGESEPPTGKAAVAQAFWRTVLVIELTDIAFAVDSILAAIALTDQFWLVFAGGVLGLILMRFAAMMFFKVLERFPSFETTAYLLVLTIGIKVIVEALELPGVSFKSGSSPAFWVFWSTMVACIGYGFLPKRQGKPEKHALHAAKE